MSVSSELLEDFAKIVNKVAEARLDSIGECAIGEACYCKRVSPAYSPLSEMSELRTEKLQSVEMLKGCQGSFER